MDLGESTTGNLGYGYYVRIPSCCGLVCAQWLLDDEQDFACPKAVGDVKRGTREFPIEQAIKY